MKRDRVQEIKDNLLRIGVQDTRRVMDVNAALTKMASRCERMAAATGFGRSFSNTASRLSVF